MEQWHGEINKLLYLIKLIKEIIKADHQVDKISYNIQIKDNRKKWLLMNKLEILLMVEEQVVENKKALVRMFSMKQIEEQNQQ